MNNEIILSVIIPVFNSEKYLNELFNSLIQNDLKNIEIIFVDDSSNDNSNKMLENFSNKTGAILKKLKKNKGVSNARNEGIKESKGKYITFIDSDDCIGKYNFKTIKEIVLKENYDYLTIPKISDKEVINQYLENEEYINKGNYIKNYLSTSIHSFCVYDKIFLRDVIINNNIRFDTNLKYSEDILFVLEYLDKCKDKFYFINTNAYYYRRIHDESAIGKPVINYFEKNIKFLDKANKYLTNDEQLLLSLVTARSSLYRIYSRKDSKCAKYNIAQTKKIFSNEYVRNALKKDMLKPITTIEKISFKLNNKKLYTIAYYITVFLYNIRSSIK